MVVTKQQMFEDSTTTNNRPWRIQKGTSNESQDVSPYKSLEIYREIKEKNVEKVLESSGIVKKFEEVYNSLKNQNIIEADFSRIIKGFIFDSLYKKTEDFREAEIISGIYGGVDYAVLSLKDYEEKSEFFTDKLYGLSFKMEYEKSDGFFGKDKLTYCVKTGKECSEEDIVKTYEFFNQLFPEK